MEEFTKKYLLLNGLNVPRETFLTFEKFIGYIIRKNQQINIISKESEENIRERHIIDSAQAIDLIDLNENTCTDIGAGGGMPGIVLAMIVKNLNKDLKVELYEKSYHKSVFLREVSRKLNLNTEVYQKDVFKTKNLSSGTIIARAFKPLPVVLELVHENFKNYKNLVLFMGKNGKKLINDTMKYWDFKFEEKKSVTSENSFLINIKNIKKKN